MILPQVEQGNLFNAINFQRNSTYDYRGFWTAWNNLSSVWLCPSDGKNGGGFMRCSGNGNLTHPAGGWAAAPNDMFPFGLTPVDPATGKPSQVVAISNYVGSFGDNYASQPGPPSGGDLSVLPWETPTDATGAAIGLAPGQPRRGWPGGWGTKALNGHLRGIFAYWGEEVVGINSTTDGTSNTIMVGESLPYQCVSIEFWHSIGGSAGTTVPLGWNTNTVPDSTIPGGCGYYEYCPSCTNAQLGCRFNYASKGFKSEHPGGANFAMVDGSVHFFKKSINPDVYNALGSRNGGEVVSSDSY
jgi:prepilin-type processing-associated H-X9-DG protein